MNADSHPNSEKGTGQGDQHAQMIHKWRWRDYLIIVLGLWLAAGAWSGASHGLLLWSDVLSGAAVVALGILVLRPRFDLLRWAICFLGIWLLFAPLVFWAKEPAGFSNNTLMGALLISFSVLIPMMPSRAHHEVMNLPGPDTPLGWTYNPSDWVQRGPIIAMAFVGFFLSHYLAAFQLGHIGYPWDPFFPDGTRSVLESKVSRLWPISDAGLGALSYLLEALSGFMGGVNRWRTMPWMVVMFGVLVVPLGVVSIVLIILQPLVVGAWCTLCLVTAVAMLVMISPAVDEVVAMCQFLTRVKREGRPFWRTFWLGGTIDMPDDSQGMIAREPSPSPAWKLIAAMDFDNVAWNVALSAALGVWLMFAPAALGAGGAAADREHLCGALAVTFAVIAFGEVCRPIRLLNIPLGLYIAFIPWIFDSPGPSRWSDLIAGLAIAALSVRRGPIRKQFGGWNRCLV